jgi:hypothetical protein
MTTTCEQIAADAPGLAALPPDAPERLQAEEHARTCPACANALEEGRLLMEALDGAAPPLPAVEPLREAAGPALQPILHDLRGLAASRARAPGRLGVRAGVTVASAALAAWALPLALSQRPLAGGRTLGASLALALVAALAATATVASGGVVAGAFPVISALMSIMAGDGNAFRSHIGVHCALTELGIAAAATVLAAAVTWRRSGPDATLFVAAAGGGALATQAALHETCPAANELPHLLLYHTGALMLAVALALAAARTLQARLNRTAAADVAKPR